MLNEVTRGLGAGFGVQDGNQHEVLICEKRWFWLGDNGFSNRQIKVEIKKLIENQKVSLSRSLSLLTWHHNKLGLLRFHLHERQLIIILERILCLVHDLQDGVRH